MLEQKWSKNDLLVSPSNVLITEMLLIQVKIRNEFYPDEIADKDASGNHSIGRSELIPFNRISVNRISVNRISVNRISVLW